MHAHMLLDGDRHVNTPRRSCYQLAIHRDMAAFCRHSNMEGQSSDDEPKDMLNIYRRVANYPYSYIASYRLAIYVMCFEVMPSV